MLGAELRAQMVERAAHQGAPAAGGEQRRIRPADPRFGRGGGVPGGLERHRRLDQAGGPPRRVTADKGALGRQRLQIALGNEPLIGQQHGVAGNGELLRQHAGGRHAHAGRSRAEAISPCNLVVKLLLQRLVAQQIERDQHGASGIPAAMIAAREACARAVLASSSDSLSRRRTAAGALSPARLAG